MIDEFLATNSLLVPVDKLIMKKYGKAAARRLMVFARQFYASTSTPELQAVSAEDLLAELLEAWDIIKVRKSVAPKIEITQQLESDDEEEHGSRLLNIYVLLDDKPFIVDSLRHGINRSGVAIHRIKNAVTHVKRTSGRTGTLNELATTRTDGYRDEALCCIQCVNISESRQLKLKKEIREILKHVSVAVKDYPAICQKVVAVRDALLNAKKLPESQPQLLAATEFLDWLVNNHFTFLGYEEYKLKHSGSGTAIELQEDELLGVSRYKSSLKKRTTLSQLPSGIAEVVMEKKLLSFAKSSTRSRVHRPVYYDYVLVREFDERKRVIAQHRFIGLYTSSVYFRSVLDIPLLQQKVKRVLEHSGFAPGGHSSKDLLQVINQYPRDELFQVSGSDLLETATEIARIQDTRTCRLFIRRDSYGKFFSCLVYVPRDYYNTDVRLVMQRFLAEQLHAEEIEFSTYLQESVLVRVHFVLRVPGIHKVKYDPVELERKLAVLVKPWDEKLQESLRMRFGDSRAMELYDSYGDCFSAAYRESYGVDTAVDDLERIRQVETTGELELSLCRCESEVGAELSFKIFSRDQQLFLSDVDPILENLGLKIISERAFSLGASAGCVVWVHDFSLYRSLRLGSKLKKSVMRAFEDAFRAIWQQRVDDDRFNALVVNAQVHWRDAALLRAYAAYLKQIQFGYGADFIADTLATHHEVSQRLIDYFYALFQPGKGGGKKRRPETVRKRIMQDIDSVVNLSEDSVLRGFVSLMDATLRTNFFQHGDNEEPKDYFSFKFNLELIEGVPLPRPKFEIFVFARRMEGVHLRGGPVARGGLRWSDRTEDYRTEVLGLVKAQQVKNSVIVPVGAKGCFVVKEAAENREQFQKLGIACYETFICGLLDITDNLVAGEIVPPVDVIRRDEDDPYLVVAADKGTATFSDIANRIATNYNFWLGDGFASGGSNGYDHKAMGITARGAWISVQRHFRELGVNIQQTDFSVVGIGDMAGDVFGNGMMLSRHICLVAAFNHMHIFIDPQPDSAASFKERKRLFKMPRSSWADYNAELISSGGGVFERSSKSIAITPEMKAVFDISANTLTPDQLIKALLRAPVDLIWNGGIGTYVKSSEESHGDVGDKTNDSLRISAPELRCKVIGEGGNLGLTQSARIEFGRLGGISLTDFVDNSAGVDCSDHEVNIKILLNKVVEEGKLTTARRNRLLVDMTDEVAALVLDNNYNQVQSISIAQAQMASRDKEYAELISYLEQHAGLDRDIENLPGKEEMEERLGKQEYLTRPEIAVLTSYMKMYLKALLPCVDYIEDDYFDPYLQSAFPPKLREGYGDEIELHPLKKQIIATQVANSLVNVVGPSFIYRMSDSTGSSPAEVVRVALIVRDVFQIDRYWQAVEALDFKVAASAQIDLLERLIRLMRRATRWLLRNRHGEMRFGDELVTLQQDIEQIRTMLPEKLPEDFQRMFADKLEVLDGEGVPQGLANDIVRCEFLFPAISFIDVRDETGEDLDRVVDVFYGISEALQLNWLGKIINQLPVANYWQALARESFLDDLSRQQKAFCVNVVNSGARQSAQESVAKWMTRHEDDMARVRQMLNQLQSETQPDYSMFSVALRELGNLAESTVRSRRR